MSTTVTGYTAARSQQMEDTSIVDSDYSGNNLILTRRNGTTINVGSTKGPTGDPGPAEVNYAQLDAATDPSIDAGNDVVNGSDGKLFFDHEKSYFYNIPVFADAASRDSAISSPFGGQSCYMLDSNQYLIYRSTNGWRPPLGRPWGILGMKTDTATPTFTQAQGQVEISTNLRIQVLNYPANRLLKATLNILMYSSVSTPGAAFDVYNNWIGVNVCRIGQGTELVNQYGFGGSVLFPSVAGNATYTPRITVLTASTGSVILSTVGGTIPTRFTVEDIGPVTPVVN